jgi:thiol:disulfide interchange protein DsbD
MRKLLALIAMFLCIASARAQLYQGKTLVEPELLANVDAVIPGQKFTVGLLLKMQPGWHTYWQYSGDSGMPTRIDWKLPLGFRAGEIQWPLPEKIVEPGDVVTYAYQNEVLLLVDITPPANFREKTITIKAHAHWLVCEKLCVPGEAELVLDLPVAPSNKPLHEEFFAKYRAELPKDGALPFEPKWSRKKEILTVELGGLPPGAAPEFFPLPDSSISVGHPQTTGSKISVSVGEIPSIASLNGVVAIANPDGTRTGWMLGTRGSVASPPSTSLAVWLLFGFIGGLILNVMPCVLPVIALKIFGFIKQAGESPVKIFRLGLAFVAGIFAWFLALAALVAGFKAAGHDLNWAFQFQHPAFLAAMIAIIFVFALNLLGVFEIMLPGRMQTHLGALSAREGYGGTFLHGVFATLMATPCTAPFLGPALGFAFAQRAPVIFAMFGAIAAGMSAPYLLLAARPAWLRFLPKPGVWMVRVKQAMGVLLLGTVIWLGWVFWQQQSVKQVPFAPVLAAALEKGQPVFVDFTADWCVNCKVNERLVLNTDAVQRGFRENEVLFLKADWTNGDPDITKLLKQFGRAGVPLYVLYPARGEPIVLPEVITTNLVLDALKRARNEPSRE